MLNKLKKLFIVEEKSIHDLKVEPQEDKTNPSEKNAIVKENDFIPDDTSETNPVVEKRKGEVNEKLLNVLLKAMEKNNQEGFDYLEFKNSLRSLEKMPMDEATRFQSALAMAATMNATADSLIKTANIYLDVLKGEEQKFNTALQAQRERQIKSKSLQVEQLQKTVQEKAERIKKLTQEIETTQKQISKVKEGIKNSTASIENTRSDFEASFGFLVRQILNDIANMKKHLTPPPSN